MNNISADKKEMLGKILKLEAFLFAVGGFFFSTKQYFSDLVLLNPNTDLYLGYALIIVGLINIIIANKFFGVDKTK